MPGLGAAGTSVVMGRLPFFHSGMPPSRSDALAPSPAYCSVSSTRVDGDSHAVGDRIGVDVVDVPGLVGAETRDDRNVPARREEREGLDVAVEFILEGMHVNNKLNKNIKAGASSYKR